MKRILPIAALTVLILTGCAQPAPPAAPQAAAPVDAAINAPQALLQAPAPPAIDTDSITHAAADLRALGYAVGKGTPGDPALLRALIAFEKDQGLPEDGEFSQPLLDKLKLARAAIRPSNAPLRNAEFFYSGSANRQAITLATPPEGWLSDAPANFLLPLRPGTQAMLHLNRKGGAPISIICHVGKSAPATLPMAGDMLAVDCHGDGVGAPQWRDLFSTRLGVVAERQMPATAHQLIAVRPATAAWPVAARTGLDWALSSALDAAPGAAPVQWSSTGVVPHFEIRASARIAGSSAGLGNGFAVCRRFELAQTGSAASYPGIACQNPAGSWVLPESGVTIASPAGSRSARN